MTEPTLRRPTLADLPALMAGVGQQAVYAGLLQMPYPSEWVWRQRIEDAAQAPADELLLVAELEGALVGIAGLHRVGPSPRRAHARTLGLWVRPEAQGRGVGRALLQALIDYAERWAGVRRLELTVNVDNPRAIALYRRCGFVEEGRLRAYALRDGEYVDCLTMARCASAAP